MISEEKDPKGVFRAAVLSGEAEYFDDRRLESLMPPKPADSNKGTYGRAVLFAGSALYPGAALLSAKACLAGGCGLLSVYSDEAARPYFAPLPEAIFRTRYDIFDAAAAIRSADAVLAGPGWGEGDYGTLLRFALSEAKTLLLDADALNFTAKRRELLPLLNARTVLSPHPGEMARLTGLGIGEITADPVRVCSAYAREWGCTVLLKGTCTAVSDGERTAVTAAGNCGLAKGGSGDVLSGLITAMLARGKQPFEAAVAGALLLGTGADRAYRALGERMLRASGVTDAIMQGIL